MNGTAPSLHTLFPAFPLFSVFPGAPHVPPSGCGGRRAPPAARVPPSRHLLTDQLGSRWFSCFVWALTRWEACRSSENSARRLSASAGQKSFLLSYPFSSFYLQRFILDILPTWDIYFITFMCFLPPSIYPVVFKSISAPNSLLQFGFLPNAQGILGWFVQLIRSTAPTGKLLDTSIYSIQISSSTNKYLRYICKKVSLQLSLKYPYLD